MRFLRALGARGGSWILVALVAAVTVCAAVVGSGASTGAARSAALAPLLLVAAVLVTAPATELARHRRAEIALVRVRGGHGVRLVGAVVGESVAAVLLGAVVGLVAAGILLHRLATTWSVDGLLGGAELAAAAVATATTAVPALGCAVVVAREPLAVALRRPSWSGPGARLGFLGLVLGVGVVLAAVVAVYRAATAAPGALVLAGPALLGLAAGQLLVWLHRALGRRAGLAAGRSLGPLLGVRRALAPDHAPILRGLVAAGTVVAASACAASATGAWADDAARVGNGGPVRFDLPAASALQGLLLTEELDPDGRWLLAAAVTDQRDEASRRVAWLDLGRYERVVAGHLATTPADVSAALGALRAAEPVRVVTGEVVTVRGASPTLLTVDYLDDDGVVSTVEVEVEVEVGTDAVGSAPVDDCRRSCVFLGVAASADTRVSAVSLGDDVLVDGPLELTAGSAVQPEAATAPVPMLVAGTLEAGTGSVDGIGGSPRPLEVVGERAGLPLLSGAGLLGDLRVGLAAAGGSVPAVESVVLARSDTPQRVLDGLAAAGAEGPQTWEPADRELAPRELAERRVGLVTMLAAGALGMLVLLAGARRRTDAARQEGRALRLVGVGRRPLRTAVLVEAGLVGTAVGATTGISAWLTTSTVVDGADLVRPGPTDLPFGSVVSSPELAAVGAVVGVLALGMVLLVRRLGARR